MCDESVAVIVATEPVRSIGATSMQFGLIAPAYVQVPTKLFRACLFAATHAHRQPGDETNQPQSRCHAAHGTRFVGERPSCWGGYSGGVSAAAA